VVLSCSDVEVSIDTDFYGIFLQAFGKFRNSDRMYAHLIRGALYYTCFGYILLYKNVFYRHVNVYLKEQLTLRSIIRTSSVFLTGHNSILYILILNK